MPPASMRVEAPWPNSGVGEDHGRRDWRWASPRRGIARGNKVPQEEFQWVPWRLVNVGTRGNSTSNSCSRTLFGYKSEVLCLDLETKMRCKNAGLLLHLLHCCSIAALLLLGCVFVRPRTIGKLSHRLEHRGSSPPLSKTKHSARVAAAMFVYRSCRYIPCAVRGGFSSTISLIWKPKICGGGSNDGALNPEERLHRGPSRSPLSREGPTSIDIHVGSVHLTLM